VTEHNNPIKRHLRVQLVAGVVTEHNNPIKRRLRLAAGVVTEHKTSSRPVLLSKSDKSPCAYSATKVRPLVTKSKATIRQTIHCTSVKTGLILFVVCSLFYYRNNFYCWDWRKQKLMEPISSLTVWALIDEEWWIMDSTHVSVSSCRYQNRKRFRNQLDEKYLKRGHPTRGEGVLTHPNLQLCSRSLNPTIINTNTCALFSIHSYVYISSTVLG